MTLGRLVVYYPYVASVVGEKRVQVTAYGAGFVSHPG